MSPDMRPRHLRRLDASHFFLLNRPGIEGFDPPLPRPGGRGTCTPPVEVYFFFAGTPNFLVNESNHKPAYTVAELANARQHQETGRPP